MEINSDAARAFMEGIYFSRSNTVCERDASGLMVMRLHGNPIAKLNTKTTQMWITTAGYDTHTTKARLNAILQRHVIVRCNSSPRYHRAHHLYGVHHKKGELFLGPKRWTNHSEWSKLI